MEQGNRVALVRDNPYSANVILTFGNNDMEVRADFIPPAGAGTPLTMEMIRTFLAQQNVVYGIREDVIKASLAEIGSGSESVTNALIAKGDHPVAEIAEHFELNRRLILSAPPADPKRRIDYRDYSPFVIVKKGQALAYKRLKVTGKEGKNVRGESIPFQTIVPEGVTGGNNTQTDDKFITAAINGQFIQNKQVLNVEKCLVIKSGVGYATGHISFPGDVVIEGPVSDGFKIYAEGSVTIKQTLDVTEVITRGDLIVAGGIIGRGQAIAKVRGRIKTKFIENCHVACWKTVQVERAIINSTVFAMDKIDLGDKGFIISGDMTSVHGIRAAKIGKAAGRGAKLHCGIDFTVQQEQEKANQHFQLLTAKIEKIQYLIAQPETYPEKRSKLEELLKGLLEEQHKLGERISDLLRRINADEKAVVEVYGEIASGTLIEICQVALFVTDPMRKVRIKLDTFSNKLIAEPL
ncbi:MAG: FapA family protein [Spirochaetaceae bacterium]|jgi:uncharacterized protein (DUF342 family)|nr:FapA family protein [Spirochaetaceae bacterium]